MQVNFQLEMGHFKWNNPVSSGSRLLPIAALHVAIQRTNAITNWPFTSRTVAYMFATELEVINLNSARHIRLAGFADRKA